MPRLPLKSRRPATIDFSQADAELEGTLENLECAGNYAQWIFELLEPHLGPEVLEVGAGHGTFTERIARSSTRVVAVEPSARCVDLLQTRFSSDEHVEVLHGVLDSVSSSTSFDSAVLVNVLEHIEDDDEALQRLFELLKPGGLLILWVPAFGVLYSDFDRRVGHYRRYRKSALRSQLTRCGYEIRDLRYVNILGAIAWLIIARLLRQTPTVGSRVRTFDQHFVPSLKRLERRYGVPFGQSLFAVATRPGSRDRI